MDNKTKKLVFITARLPYPASSGRKNVMYNYCKILHEVYGYQITVISFLEAGDSVEPMPTFIHKVVELPPVSGKRKIKNLLKDTFLFRKSPMQVSLYYEPKLKALVESICKDINPDLIIADMVRTTEYAKNLVGYKIADLDDMLSIRYERQLAMDIATINPYGAYLYSMPVLVQKILSLRLVKKIVLTNEIKLLKKYERCIVKEYDRTVFVADREADLLNQELNFDKAIAIPLGVDVNYFGKFFGKIKIHKHTIGFLGAMSVAHNEAGAIHFIQDILPLVKKKIPDVKFVVVGGGITENLKNCATDAVEFTGRVDDVRTVLGQCEVFVCPLTFGSGIKTKNLEAMAMGVPVVTTTIGAENINAVDNKDWLVADSDQEFADKIVQIMSDDKLHEQLMTNGYNFVVEHFTWKVAEERFKKIL